MSIRGTAYRFLVCNSLILVIACFGFDPALAQQPTHEEATAWIERTCDTLKKRRKQECREASLHAFLRPGWPDLTGLAPKDRAFLTSVCNPNAKLYIWRTCVRNALQKYEFSVTPAESRQQVQVEGKQETLSSKLTGSAQTGLRLPTLKLGSSEPKRSASEFCSSTGFLTIANGGYSTFETQDDAEFVLSEQFCNARLYATNRSRELASAGEEKFSSATVETCSLLGTVIHDAVGNLTERDPGEVAKTIFDLAESSGRPSNELSDTGIVCLGVGYFRDDTKVSIGAAVLMFALGEVRYAEMVGQHFLHGIGPDKNPELAILWFRYSQAGNAQADVVSFAPKSTERDRLVSEAIRRLSDLSGG